MDAVCIRVEQLRKPVEQVANDYLLPVGLVLGFIEVESGGDPWAWNPEPPYRYLWDVAHHRPFRQLSDFERISETPPKDFACLVGDRDQEWWGQQSSYGLMQVMGAVAREYGCDLPYLTALCDPYNGLTYGCRHLSALVHRYGGSAALKAAIAAYNAGTPREIDGKFVNQAYVDSVLAAAKRFGFAG